MRDGRRSRDDALAEAMFAARRERAAAEGDPAVRLAELRSVARDFDGLCDVSSVKSDVARLERDPETRDAAARERALAATLAASHDLGKLLSYREDASGTWTAHSAVPHDSLGAQILALCPSLHVAFAESEVEDLLLALHTEHAPDLVPSNCRSRVQQLRRWLKEADAAAAAQDRTRSTARSPGEVEEEIADA